MPYLFLVLAAVAVLIFVGWLARQKPAERLSWAVVDGSNLLYWTDGAPDLAPLREAVVLLVTKGYEPYVIFDANAGYRISDSYKDAPEFARLLGLEAKLVEVVGKGEPADPLILKTAKDRGACVVSNDRFRDWASGFPQVRTRGYVVHGGYHKGKLWLDFDGSRPRAGQTR